MPGFCADQFGAANGFTTMSVTKNQMIIYPSFSDAELADGKEKADRQYVPVSI